MKQQVDEEVTRMEADFKIYKLEMAAKKRAFQPTPPSPASPAPSPPCPGPGSALLCAQQNQTPQLLVGDQAPYVVQTLDAFNQPVSSGGQDLVNQLQQKEDEYRALAWAYYWAQSPIEAMTKVIGWRKRGAHDYG